MKTTLLLTVAVPVAQHEGVEPGQVDVHRLDVAADAEAFGTSVEKNLELLIADRRLLSRSASSSSWPAYDQDAEPVSAAAEVLEPREGQTGQLVHGVQVMVQVLGQLMAESRGKALQPLDA